MESDQSSTLRLRPAPVLAGVGTFLLIAAAVSFVSARWDRFGPGDRFLALLVCSAAVVGLTAGLRRIAPATARSLDVLMAALVPVDVAALAIVSGATWPTVLIAAGPAAIAASETLRRRDPSVITELGTVVGGLLSMCGLAAHYDVALAPLVAALGLLACVIVPWNRMRLAGPLWAMLAGLAPVLRVLDEAAFTGDGTMRRLGLLDATPWEATLLAGAIAAIALGSAAVVRRSLTAGVAVAAVVGATGAAMWAEHEPPRSLLVVAAAVLVALVELTLTHRSFARLAVLHDVLASASAAINGALTFVVAAFAVAGILPEAEEFGPEWVYVAAALAFAWAVADVRRMHDAGRTVVDGGGWAPATWGGGVTLAAGSALAAGATTAGTVVLAVGAGVLASRRSGRLALAWTAGVVGPVLLTADWRLAVGGAVVGTVLVALASVAAHRHHDELLGGQAVAGLSAPIVVAAVAVGDHSSAGAGAVVLGLLWLAATIVDVRIPSVALGLRGLGVVAVAAVAADDPVVVAWVLFGSAVAWLAHHLATRQASSIILGSWSTLLGAGLLVADVVSEPWVAFAAAVAGGGLALVGWGVDRNVESARMVGAFVVWWASLVALTGAEIASLEPYVYPVLLGLAWALHRDAGSDRAEWVAVGFPLVSAAIVAFGQRVDGGNAGHTILLGAVALALCALGAIRRHQAALVIGAAATVAVGAFEALDRVVGIESWSWLVVSGSAALTIAAMLEAGERDRGLVG